MMKIAIVKPDHIGDLVLSSAAIRAIARHFKDATLFVSSGSRCLANYLFDGLSIREINFPHLAKAGAIGVAYPDLREFDLVVFLRSDGVINEQWASLRCRDFLLPVNTNDDHQSIIDFSVASALVGKYNIDELFYADKLNYVRNKTGNFPKKVGFSIGSGFHTNTWLPGYWISLGEKLNEGGVEIKIICGGLEVGLSQFIARKIGLDPVKDVIVGGNDFGSFLGKIGGLDLVIASDGGTGHLCSLVCPVLSVFGSSPFRRFAPYGAWEKLVTIELDCSPCFQYDARRVNGCLTMECMAGISPDDVMTSMRFTYSEAAVGSFIDIGEQRRLYFGASHIDQNNKINTRIKESERYVD